MAARFPVILAVRLPRSSLDRLRRICKQTGLERAELIRRAVDLLEATGHPPVTLRGTTGQRPPKGSARR